MSTAHNSLYLDLPDLLICPRPVSLHLDLPDLLISLRLVSLYLGHPDLPSPHSLGGPNIFLPAGNSPISIYFGLQEIPQYILACRQFPYILATNICRAIETNSSHSSPSWQFYLFFIGLSDPNYQESIHFPTLAELNAELFEWDPEEEDAMLQDEAIYNDTEIFAVTRSQAAKSPGLEKTTKPAPNPTPPIQAYPAPRVP